MHVPTIVAAGLLVFYLSVVATRASDAKLKTLAAATETRYRQETVFPIYLAHGGVGQTGTAAAPFGVVLQRDTWPYSRAVQNSLAPPPDGAAHAQQSAHSAVASERGVRHTAHW